MSRKNLYRWGLLPVLSLMMVSPSDMSKAPSRSLAAEPATTPQDMAARKRFLLGNHQSASVEQVVVEGVAENAAEAVNPLLRYNAVSEKATKANPHQANAELTREVYIRNLESIVSLVDQEKNTIDNELGDRTLLKDARLRVEGEVHALTQYEADLVDLKARNLVAENDEKKPSDLINATKLKLEDLLKKVEDREKVVAEEDKAAAASPQVIAQSDVAATPVVAEIPAAGPAPVEDGSTPTKEETDLDKILCDLRDQNKAMNESIQKLMTDNQTIMQSMMTMMQNFMSYQQSQQQIEQARNLYQFYPQNQNGNWQYQPTNFQASTSIFGEMPAITYSPLLNQVQNVNGNVNQSAAASGSWSLRQDPGLQLSDPRMSVMQNIMPSQFGPMDGSLLGNFGMDMSTSFMPVIPQGFQLAPMMMQPSEQQIPFTPQAATPPATSFLRI